MVHVAIYIVYFFSKLNLYCYFFSGGSGRVEYSCDVYHHCSFGFTGDHCGGDHNICGPQTA